MTQNYSDFNVSISVDLHSINVSANLYDQIAEFDAISAQFASHSRATKALTKNKNIVSPQNLKPIEGLVPLVRSLYFLKGRVEQDTGILPPGVLYIDDSFIIFERPPSFQNISLIPRIMDDIRYDRNEEKLYRLPIPWQVYMVHYTQCEGENGELQLYTSGVRMLFTSGPIQSFDDIVHLPPLTNLYTNGTLCRPFYESMDDIERYPKNIAGVIQSAYDWVWNSGSNIDLTNCIVQYYIQLRNDIITNTVFSKADAYLADDIKVISQGFGIDSYFCGFSYIQKLFLEWEKFSLEEVIDLRWPSPSHEKTMSVGLYNSYLDELMEYVRVNGYVAEDDMHYDEESDFYYQCEERGCSCLGGDSVDYYKFLTDCKLWPPENVTLKSSMNSFIKEMDTISRKFSHSNFVSNLALKLYQDISQFTS